MMISRMDSDPTAVGRIPALQPLSPASTVGEAAAHLRATGEGVAVVMRGGRPVGLVSAEPLHEAVRSGDSDALVQSMMDYVAVPVPPGPPGLHPRRLGLAPRHRTFLATPRSRSSRTLRRRVAAGQPSQFSGASMLIRWSRTNTVSGVTALTSAARTSRMETIPTTRC